VLMMTTAKNAKYAKYVAREEGSPKQMFFAYLAYFAVVHIPCQSVLTGLFSKERLSDSASSPKLVTLMSLSEFLSGGMAYYVTTSFLSKFCLNLDGV
jgi:hypothetical protein